MGYCRVSRVPICLRSLSAHPIEVPAKATAGQVTPVYPLWSSQQKPQVGLPMAHRRMDHGSIKSPGLGEWPQAEQVQARELLLKWEHLFACHKLGLCKTSMVMHQIKLTDLTPIKDHYQCIPPHMYDDVKARLQEMLDIGAIRKSQSPWASMVVWVWKKEW